MARRSTIGAVLLLLLGAGVADARTWHVRKDGTGDYTVIQDAVDHAAAGDTVMIGPGRYEEKRPYTSYAPEKWIYDVYVAVDVSDLTIIGSGQDQTIIGPPEPIWQNPQQPKIVCALSRVKKLVIEDLTLECVCDGVYRGQGGSLEVRRSTIRNCSSGVLSWGDLGTLVEECRFIDNTGRGILSWYPAQNVIIRSCLFIGPGTYADQTINVHISDCQYQGGTTGATFVAGTTGSASNCSYDGMSNVAVVVGTGASIVLQSNALNGGATNLMARDTGTIVTGVGNIFGGGSFSTVQVSNCSVTMHGNHILHGTGPSVYLQNFASEPIRYLDFTNNYWGTASADSIASWIHDRRDDRTIYAYVQYQPFSAQPVAANRQSWGGLKSRYRR